MKLLRIPALLGALLGLAAAFTGGVSALTPPAGTLIVGRATANCSDANGNTLTAVSASVTTPLAAGPRLSVLLSETPAIILPGQNLTYTLDVFNTGNGPASGVGASLYLPPEVSTSSLVISGGGILDPATRTISWTVASLASGQAAQFTVTSQLLATVTNGTVFASSAAAAAGSQYASIVSSAAAGSGSLLSVGLTGPASVTPGGLITYSITYANTGNAPAAFARLTAPVPALTSYSTGTASGGGYASGGNIVWDLGSVPAASSGTVSYSVTVSTLAAGGAVVLNSVSALSQDSSAVSPQASTLVSDPSVVFTSTAAPAQVAPGGRITITLDFTNDPAAALYGLTLTALLPEHTAFVSADNAGAYAAGQAVWSLGNLLAGESRTVRLTVDAAGGLTNGTIIRSSATAAATGMPVKYAYSTVTIATSSYSGSIIFTDQALAQVSVYRPGDTLYLEMTNPGANLDSGAVETATVTVTCAATGDSETVTLTETAPGSGVFRGSIASVAGASAAGNGTLGLTADSSVRVTRSDAAAPGGALSAEALVDPYGVVFNSVTGAPVRGAVVTLRESATGDPAVLGVGQQNPYTADAAGRFYFPFVPAGSYYFTVAPGAGFVYPTVLPAADITAGFNVSTGSRGETFTFSGTSAVLLDIPVDPGAAAFSVSKTCDRPEAYTGDILYCSVSVTNTGGSPAAALRVVDLLPHGFGYAKGTSRLDGAPVADPGLPAAARAVWAIPSPAPGAAHTLRYAMLLGADSEKSDGVNRAYAEGTTLGAAFVTNTASFKVRTGGGVFTSRGTLLGRVFIDADADGLYDEGEAGVEGADVYTEDGVRARTDGRGLYHINSAQPGSRVVRLDTALLPPGLQPEPINHRFADDGASQFADMDRGGLRKANFALYRSTAYYAGACAAPARQQEQKAAAGPDYALILSSGPRELQIVSPADGSALPSRRASAAVKLPAGSSLKLYVNGVEVPGTKIGRRMLNLANSAELYEFVALEFEKGRNTIKAEVYDLFGNKRGETQINVTAPGDPARVGINLPTALPPADGRSLFSAVAELLDENGARLPYSVLVTAELSAGSFSGEDADPAARGFQVRLENGAAEVLIRAPEEPGQAVLKVAYGKDAAGEAEFEYKPHLRDMLVTGIADLRLGRSSAGGVSSNLHKVSFMEKGTYANGRGAFFAKGRLWKELDLTAAYDTAKESGGPQFRQDEALAEGEARYPLYGDESSLKRETQSADKLFVKASVRRSSLLWGDYWTGLQDTRLAQHQRSLTGARLVSELGPARFTAFAAKTNYTRVVKAQRGKGTSGFYYLDVLPMVPGSEKVVIEARDRQYPERVLSRRLLARDADYTVDTELGSVLFKEPVPSVDQDFNPVYVMVSYESSGGARKNAVYGGRAAASAGPLDLGVTGVVEENQAGDFRLSGADAAVKLPLGTALKAEAAATRSLFEEGGVYALRGGSAWTVGLETRPLDLFTLTALRTRTGQYFNNTSALGSIRGSERFEAGLSLPLSASLALRGKYSEDRDTLNGGAVYTRSAGLEKKGKKYSGSLDLEDEESSRRYIPSAQPGTRAPFDFSEAQAGHRTSARAKVKTALGRFGLAGEYSQDIRSGRYATAQAGAEYNTGGSKLYLREAFDRSGDRREARSLFGIEKSLSGDLTAVDEYRLRNGADGSALQQSIGLRNRHAFSGRLTGTAAVEHLKTLSGDSRLADPDAFAVSAGLEYLPHDKLKLTGRGEYRTSDPVDSWLGEFNAGLTLGSGWALLNQNRLVYEDYLGGAVRRSGRYSLGLSYRPEDSDTFNGLLKTEYRDSRNTGSAQGGNFGAFIFSGEGVYQPSRPLQLTGRYAGKLAKDGGFSAYTDLAAVKFVYDIGRRWDVGGEYRLLISRSGGGQASGGFLETGYLLGKDLWLSGGYSFDKFDADLAGDGYWGRGPYLRLRIKFDDTLLRGKDSDGDGVKDKLDKCPGSPVCGPVGADGCAAAAPVPLPEPEPAMPAPLPAPDLSFSDADSDGIADADSDGIADAADACPASAPCAVVDSSGCACPYQEPVLNLDINFQPGKAEILPEYRDKLEEAAELLEERPDVSFAIEGHTDNSGKPADNLRLSRFRAENVRDTLIERYGADADRVTAAGYGDTRPITGNETPEGRAKNRRVVAVLHTKQGADAEAGKCPARPETEKDERGCPKPIKAEQPESVQLDIQFETGKAAILPEYEHEVLALAEFLRKYPSALAEIEGHTDNLGNPKLNKELSARRARAVADMLADKYAIDRARLEPHGYGDSRPIADNDTPEGRRKNRRVIAIITRQ